jgi:GGDEF domain-containing protein
VGTGSEIAPRPCLRRAAETALAALLASVGARRARLEIAEGGAGPPWVLTLGEGGETGFTRGASAPTRAGDPRWLPLEAAPPPPEGEERRRSRGPVEPLAWLRLDPAPGGDELDRLGPSLRLAALALESVARLARHERDESTDLLNRRGLLARLEELLPVVEASRLALLLLDVRGREDGSSLLPLVAGLARRCLRRGDVLARLEPGTLAALLPGADGGEAASAAGRLQRALRRHERRIPAAAGGLAVAPHHGRSPEELIGRASTALAEARRRAEPTLLLYDERLDAGGSG